MEYVIKTPNEKEKEARIKKEITKLNKIMRNVDADKRKSMDSLIKNAAFMTVTLEDLQKQIIEKGATERYQHGAGQWGMKKSAAVDVYNTMIKNHVSVMKQIADAVPKEQKEELDEFAAFVAKR